MSLITAVKQEDVRGFAARNGTNYVSNNAAEVWAAFLAQNGGTGTSLPALEATWLAGQGAVGNNLRDLWGSYLKQNGYSGNFEDQLRTFFSSGFGFSASAISGLAGWYKADSGVLSDAAAQFTSADKDYLTIADNATLSLGNIDFTIAGWVYLDSKGATSQTIAMKGTANSNVGIEFRLHWITGTDRFQMGVSNGTTLTSVTATTFGAPSTSTWYFVVAYHDATADKIYIQINNGTADEAAHTVGSQDTSGNFHLGFNTGTSNYWSGRLDSIGFWKRTLTTAEKTWLYNSGSGRLYTDIGIAGTGGADLTTSLVSWWDLGEENGTRFDSHGTNHLSEAWGGNIIDATTLNGGFETLGAGKTFGSELISSNTDFETYTGTQDDDVSDTFTGWSVFSPTGIVDATATAQTGTNAVKITCGTETGTSGARITRTITVASSTRYRLTFYTRGDGTNAGRYRVFDATNSANIISIVSTGITGTTYTQIVADFFTPATCTSITIFFHAPALDTAVAYFDNTSFKQITADDVFGTWVESISGTSTINDETVTIQADSHAARFDIDASNSSVTLAQATALVANKRYSYSVYSRHNGTTASLSVNVGGTATIHALTSSYVQYSGTAVGTGTNFTLARSGATSASIYIDAVVVTAAEVKATQGIAAGSAQDSNFAAQFTAASSEYLSVADDATLSTGATSFSFACWIYSDDALTTERWIATKGGNGATNGEWFLRGLGTGTLNFGIVDSSDTSKSATSAAISPRTWYFVYGEYDRDADTVSIQLNNGTAVTTTGVTLDPNDEAGAFFIGAENNGGLGTPAKYWGGRIDNVGFWKRTLTSAEKTWLFNDGLGRSYYELGVSGTDGLGLKTSLAEYWDLDEASGNRTGNHAGTVLTDNSTVTQANGVNYAAGIVGKWTDQSSSANNATQATLSKRPQLVRNAVNGKPLIRFDGVDDDLTLGSVTPLQTTSRTIFIVMKNTSTPIAAQIMYGMGSNWYVASQSTDRMLSSYTNSTPAQETPTSSNNALSTSSYNIATYRFETAGSDVSRDMWANGTSVFSNVDADGHSTSWSASPRIGSLASVSNFFSGDIAEIIFYNTALSTADRERVQRYLANKYGITLA